jgi:hypothetical protein
VSPKFGPEKPLPNVLAEARLPSQHTWQMEKEFKCTLLKMYE